MNNQQQQVPVRQTAFSRDLNDLTRAIHRDEDGVYQFQAPINDMFVTMGLPIHAPEGATAEEIAEINTRKFRILSQVKGLVKRYNAGGYDNTLARARGINFFDGVDQAALNGMEVSRFHNLIQSRTMRFTVNGKTQIKLIHFLSRIYSDAQFFADYAGRYPLKIFISVDSLTIQILANNAQQFRDFILSAFFKIMAKADFLNAAAGGGIDYAGYEDEFDGDGDLNIDEDEHGNPIPAEAPAEAPVLNRFPGRTITLLVVEYARLFRGRAMPKQLKLPSEFAKSVICPNNQDQFCMVWCLLISNFIMRDEDAYKKIRNKLSLNALEKFPIIAEKFAELTPQFAPLYEEEGYIKIDEDNLAELERIFNSNINIYNYVDGRARIIIRSSFSNVETNHVTRLLYVPYSTMQPVKAASNVKKYDLGSKTAEDFNREIDADTEAFFSENDGHFCLLTPNSPLISGEKISDNYAMCEMCDSVFRGEAVFFEHRKSCAAFQAELEVKTQMEPNKKGSGSSFTRYETLSKIPFVLYADTESQTNSGVHKLFSFAIHAIHETDPSLNLRLSLRAKKESEVGDFMQRQFQRYLTTMRIHLRENTNLYPELDATECAEFLANNVKDRCAFCNEVPLTKEKVKNPELLVIHNDSNRPSPNIVGFLCRKCHKKARNVNNSFPIFFHHLPYDMLTLVKSLAEKQLRLNIDGETVTCNLELEANVLAKTSMKYAALTLPQEHMLCTRDDLSTFRMDLPEIRFVDSLAFLSNSLEKLVDTLATKGGDPKLLFPSTWEWIKEDYPSVAEELFACSTEKGLIAYAHTTIESMNSKTNLARDCYRSDLDLTESYLKALEEADPELATQLKENKDKKIATLEKDYARTNKVFDILQKEFGDGMNYGRYFMMYQNLDVALLADIMSAFRNTLIQTHKIDPAHYLGAPGFSQACLLYLSRKTLHFIPENLELSKLITANLRGGLSVVLSKLAEKTEKTHISGIDINNLYGWAMSQKVANRFIREVPVEEFNKEVAPKYKSLDGTYAYFCLVDVDASNPLLHDRVELLPPLVSSKTIRYEDLSEHQAENKQANYRSQKLVCSLENQTDYLTNFDNLKFYFSLGYKFTIKRVFKFEKEYIYRGYIDHNSKLRQQAAPGDDFSKDLYKLLNNIIYGKSLQRNDLRKNFEILSDPKLIHKRLVSPLLTGLEVIKENELVMAKSTPKVSKFDTCCQAGFHILELSKLRIYSIIHERILPFCRENNVGVRFLLSDTDSVYHELDFGKEGCSFSNYAEYTKAISKAHPETFDNHMWENPEVQDLKHKKQVGLFLDEEADQKTILGYVGLCSKSYGLLIRDEATGVVSFRVKGKGVPKRYLAMYQYEDYKNCVLGNLPEFRRRVEFKSFKKQGYANTTVITNKVAISSFDDKQFHYLENGVFKSLPHGHYKIAEIRAKNDTSAE